MERELGVWQPLDWGWRALHPGFSLLSFSYFLLFSYISFFFLGLLISGVSPVYIQGLRSMHDEEFWVLGHIGGLQGIPRAWIGVVTQGMR